MQKIKKNKLGFYFIHPKPDKKKLEKYYKNKYFKNTSSYKYKFTNEEEYYHKNLSLVKIFMLKKKIKNLDKKYLLDLGAGQGTFLKNISHYFKSCLGVDFSEKNLIKKHKSNFKFVSMNPEYFIEKNLNKFNVITLNNVLEHVIDPIIFMKKLKKNISKNTLIILTIPNDFSDLQKKTNTKVRKKNYWVSPPEHLNYFNKNSFLNFIKIVGFKKIDAIADFPIELFLLKKDFDYTKNPKLGKKIHLLKCEIIKYLGNNLSINDLYDFLKMIYELNIGRDNTYLLRKV